MASANTPGTLQFRNLSLSNNTLSGQFSTTPGPKNCTITFTDGSNTLGTYTLSGYGVLWNDFTCTLSSVPNSFNAVAYWSDSSDATPGVTYTATIQINQGDFMANKIVQLTNKDGDNIYPIAGGVGAGSVTTSSIEDGAVTSDKIDYATMGYIEYGCSNNIGPNVNPIVWNNFISEKNNDFCTYSSGVFTITKSGRYLLSMLLGRSTKPGANAELSAAILTDGSGHRPLVLHASLLAGHTPIAQTSSVFWLNAGDKIYAVTYGECISSCDLSNIRIAPF